MNAAMDRLVLPADTGSLHLLCLSLGTPTLSLLAMKPDFLTSLVHCYVPSTGMKYLPQARDRGVDVDVSVPPLTQLAPHTTWTPVFSQPHAPQEACLRVPLCLHA